MGVRSLGFRGVEGFETLRHWGFFIFGDVPSSIKKRRRMMIGLRTTSTQLIKFLSAVSMVPEMETIRPSIDP